MADGEVNEEKPTKMGAKTVEEPTKLAGLLLRKSSMKPIDGFVICETPVEIWLELVVHD